MLLGMVIMLAQQQGFNHIRLTVLEDVEYLALRLRFEDKREILSSTGLTPYEGLLFSYKNSTVSFTIVNSKNIPVSIFGINQINNSLSTIWLMATDGLKEIEKPFLIRACIMCTKTCEVFPGKVWLEERVCCYLGTNLLTIVPTSISQGNHN